MFKIQSYLWNQQQCKNSDNMKVVVLNNYRNNL